jgi:ubiquinone/menaquinone biosynthesis C-methylase UbiE
MTHDDDPDKARIRGAFNLAAAHFDGPEVSFWARFGARSVEHLDPQPGWRVLDVGCGTGSSALPAARRVGAEGSVVGIDFAERMVARARENAAKEGLDNATFEVADMTDMPFEAASFDAVVSVFNIFSVPDMTGQARYLGRFLRPGGRLALTTWGGQALEPLNAIWWEAVRSERPDLQRTKPRWQEIATPDALARMLAEAGFAGVEVAAEKDRHPLRNPEDCWAIVRGSSFLWTAEQMGPEAAARLREAVLARVREQGVTGIEAEVLYATATRA